MRARLALRVRLGTAEHLAGDRGDLAVAEDQEPDEMADRVALGPAEAGVRDLGGAVAQGEQHRGGRVRHRRALHPQPPHPANAGSTRTKIFPDHHGSIRSSIAMEPSPCGLSCATRR